MMTRSQSKMETYAGVNRQYMSVQPVGYDLHGKNLFEFCLTKILLKYSE